MITMDITASRLIGFYAFLLIPLGIMYFLKAHLIKKLLIATTRMSIQLALVGLYLGRLFEYNNLPLNILWLLIMLTVASGHIIRSSNLKRSELFLPVLIAITLALALILAPLVIFVVRPTPYYDARYLIPLGGMLLGNFMSMNIVALTNFTSSLRTNKQYLQNALCSGATRSEAALPFFRESFMRALIPTITTIGTLGLISLPGMLTGQLLGGSIPFVAIKYQIIIMLAILSAGAMSIFFTLYFITVRVFDHLDNIRNDIFIN